MVPLTLLYSVIVGSSVSLGMRFGLKFAGLGFALACYASFAWAARSFFGRAGGVSRSQQWILASMYGTATLQACAILYRNQGTIYHYVTGAALYTLSFLLFWSAAAAARKTRLQLFFSHVPPSTVISHGPYRLVRHPFYVSYTIAWIAGAVITDQLWLFSSVAFCHWLYYRAACLEEASFQHTPFADSYREYAKRVGRFCPRIPSWSTMKQWLLENLALRTTEVAQAPAHHFAASRTPIYQTAETA